MDTKSDSVALRKPAIIQCSAKNCLSNSKDDPDKCFFNFPPCDPSCEKSVLRCKLWVLKSGNIHLLKQNSCELTKNCFLCSDHFIDEQFVDEDSRVIAHDTIPSQFSCDPLTEEDMATFPVSCNILEPSCEGLNTTCQSSKGKKSNANLSGSTTNPVQTPTNQCQPNLVDIFSDDDVEASATIKTNDNNLVGTIQTRKESKSPQSSLGKEAQPPERKRCTPSRKAKQEAVFKIKVNQQAMNKSINESESECGKPGIKMAKRTANSDLVAKDNVPQDIEEPAMKVAKQDSKIDASVKGTGLIVTDHAERKVAKNDSLANKNVPPDEPKLKAGNHGTNSDASVKGNVSPNELAQKVAKQVANTSTVPIGGGGRVRLIAKTNLVAKNFVSKLGAKFSLPASEPLKWKSLPHGKSNKETKGTTIKNLGKKIFFSSKEQPLASGGKPKILCITNNKPNEVISAKTLCEEALRLRGTEDVNVSTSVNGDNSVIPVTRTTSTQTMSDRGHEIPRIFQILDSDQKLHTFCGIPSFQVLDSISDATLKMVMSDTAMINDIEPTLREWNIMTCSKFKLGISFEVLSVLFEMNVDACRRVIEKTSIFLRKTLALPECQKYVWSLPNEVLDGIADFSDRILTDDRSLEISDRSLISLS